MALEQLSLGPAAVDGGGDGGSAAEEGGKTARLPRWTRQEILVLIQGKRVAENRVRRGRTSGSAFGSGQIEPKWASISSYCKRHGVNRGPVQCRKRWSNLAGDYKKIKEWESRMKEETESFWVMRNDLRRERKLPGFFDREVYDILDGGSGGGGGGGEEEGEVVGGGGLSLALAPAAEGGGAAAAAAEGGGEEALFDSGRRAAADDGLFSDFERRTPAKDVPNPAPISGDTNNEKHPDSEGADNPTTQEGRKRKRKTTTDEEGEATTTTTATTAADVEHHHLIEALEKNGRLLSSQMEAQNRNLQLDREQRNEHVSSFITVLNKLADALGRIADKL